MTAITEQLISKDPRYRIVVGARSFVVTVMENKVPGERFEINYDDLSVLIIQIMKDGRIAAGFNKEWFMNNNWNNSSFFKEEKRIWFLLLYGYLNYSHCEPEESPITSIAYLNYFYVPTLKCYWKNYLIHHGKGLNPFV